MNIFMIKIIACVTMFLDHIKYASPEFVNYVTVYMGRIAFPLFAFMITEGYVHTKDLNKYKKRLFIFAIISQIPFMFFRTLTGNWLELNILFGFTLGLIAITIYDKMENKYLALLLNVAIILLAEPLCIEYGWYAVAMVVVLYIFKKNKIWMSVMYIGIVLLYFFIKGLMNFTGLPFIICTLISLPIILMYNGKKGKEMKWFFYWFYPVHLGIVYLISLI